MTHTELIDRLRRLSPSLDILSCEDVLQAADALTAAQERIEVLEETLQNALASGLPDVVADSARAALDATDNT